MTKEPFATIESALEFLTLLESAITETVEDVKKDLGDGQPDARRSDALRLTVYKLEKLDFHIARSKRAVNDLRTLRRLMFQEREVAKPVISARAAGVRK